MAAVTPAQDNALRGKTGILKRYSGTGASNTDATLTTTAVTEHKVQRLAMVLVKYSGAATQAGVTTEVDSALGSGFDTTANTGAANAQNTAYVPNGDVWLFPGDAARITALAGGSGVTATITVVVEEF